jgi:tRNA dimethylallyltransferase
MPLSAPAPPVVAVVGPTAAGKSDLAMDLAGAVRGEIINGDAMQVYRGMDLGTAKLAPAQRRDIRHHLLDVLEVTEPATVAEFQVLARAAIQDCRDRGVIPILVGGSALYIRAVLDRFEFPGTDTVVRAQLERALETHGAKPLHDRLKDLDPAAAEAILPTNGRRIVRALEVVTITGRPFAARLPEHDYVYDAVHQVGVDIPRDVLDRRIEERVQRMWEAGLVEEVRRLQKRGLREGRTAARALGYAQILRFLAGECTEEEALHETVRATRRFARRQDSWFRKDPRITWVWYDDPERLARSLEVLGTVRSG